MERQNWIPCINTADPLAKEIRFFEKPSALCATYVYYPEKRAINFQETLSFLRIISQIVADRIIKLVIYFKCWAQILTLH